MDPSEIVGATIESKLQYNNIKNSGNSHIIANKVYCNTKKSYEVQKTSHLDNLVKTWW